MKNFFIGIITMIIFFIANMFIMPFIGQHIFVGDAFTISYHMFTYTGLMLLCGILVVCTCIIVEKLNEIKNEVDKSRELPNNDSDKQSVDITK